MNRTNTVAGRVVFPLALLIASAAAAYVARQPILAVVVVAGGLAGLGIMSPLAALALYAGSIPFEEALTVPLIGTISRATGLILAASVFVEAARLGRLPRLNRLPLPAWVFVTYALVSLTWSATPQLGAFLSLLQLVVSAWLVAHVVATRRHVVGTAMNVYSVGAVVVAVMGIVAFLSNSAPTFNQARAAAFADQSVAHFASYMLPALFFGIARLTHGVRAGEALWFGTVVALTGTAVVVSGTRSAWVGVAVATLLVVVPRLGLRGVARLVLVLGVASAVAFSVPEVREFAAYRVDVAVESGGAGRASIWAVGLTLVREHFVAGAGFRMFTTEFDGEAIARTWGMTEVVGTGRAPHNVYLATLVELGVVGFLSWLAWLFVLTRRMWFDRSPMAIFLLALVVAFATQAFFLDILNRKYLYFALGLAAGLAGRRDDEGDEHLGVTDPRWSTLVTSRTSRR